MHACMHALLQNFNKLNVMITNNKQTKTTVSSTTLRGATSQNRFLMYSKRHPPPSSSQQVPSSSSNSRYGAGRLRWWPGGTSSAIPRKTFSRLRALLLPSSSPFSPFQFYRCTLAPAHTQLSQCPMDRPRRHGQASFLFLLAFCVIGTVKERGKTIGSESNWHRQDWSVNIGHTSNSNNSETYALAAVVTSFRGGIAV